MEIAATRLNACHLFFTVIVLLAFAGQAPADSNATDEDITTNVIALTTTHTTPSPDFDGDGTVGFSDFLLFVAQFGFSRDDEGYEARYDLDSDGTIGFSDFLIFVNNFGKEIPSLVVSIPDANLRAAIEAALGKASGTPITEYEMKTLTTLKAINTGISDLTGLEFATNLRVLWLGNNNITDISALAGLNNLTHLALENNNITDISVLVGLTKLRDLNLDNNNITDISALAGLNNLTWLVLGNNITDISALAGLNNLTGLGLENNNITDISALAGLNNLTALWLENNNITDISALAGLNNLTTLELGNNNITDISALAGLNNLTWLHLWNNNITDISALAGLNNLTTGLGLGNNNITDISALAGLNNLTWLSLTNNNITDISVLTRLTNLTVLYLTGNPLTVSSANDHISVLESNEVRVFFDSFREGDFDSLVVSIPDANLRAAIEAALGKASGTPITEYEMKTLTTLEVPNAGISDLTGLEFATNLTRLDLWGTNITDISALTGLTSLTTLWLTNTNITDISALAGLNNLTGLYLWNNNITDISVLAGLTNLTGLGLNNNNITDADISVLAGLNKLTTLELGNNNITDISVLAGLTNLTELWLDNNNITDISVLAGLTNLTELSLTNNITDADISVLAGLTNLTSLELNNNNITDISALAGLTNLTELELNNNNITDISALAGLTNLTELELGSNNIIDISVLAGLNNLTQLDIEFNTITDISVLTRLTNLTRLDLTGNPLTVSSVNDHISVLESNGVRVFFDSFRVVGDFDIELVFLDHFTENQKNVLRYVARRWMAVITEDLPDYEFTQGWSGRCGDQSYEIPAGERIDDLRIYISTFEGGSAVGWGSPRLLREENHLPILGCMAFDLKRANLLITGLHEAGHVLGFGRLVWGNLGLLQDLSHDDPNADTHFNGPLAIAAFNDAGGRNYAGAKVPLEKMDGSHWRGNVFDQGELMLPWGGGALSAITVQALADIGYGVDVTQADPYTLPGATAGKVSAKIAAVMPSIPSYGADVTQPDAYTRPVVGPHWQSKGSRAVSSTHEDDRLRRRLATPPTQANPKLKCGVGLINEPIHVIDKQGRIVRTISH